MRVINSSGFVRKFSIFTIFMAGVHFILENLHTLVFGQSFWGLLPDYIAVALMITGGLMVLKDPRVIGILCGAWGFAFCLHYRSWAWRFEEMLEGASTQVNDTTMYVLLFTMPISIIGFAVSLLLCLAERSEKIDRAERDD